MQNLANKNINKNFRFKLHIWIVGFLICCAIKKLCTYISDAYAQFQKIRVPIKTYQIIIKKKLKVISQKRLQPLFKKDTAH